MKFTGCGLIESMNHLRRPIVLVILSWVATLTIVQTRASETAGCGVMTPYRNEMLREIASCWVDAGAKVEPILILSVNRDGTVGSVEFEHKSKSRLANANALSAIKRSHFKPFPEWFHDESISFKVNFVVIHKIAHANEQNEGATK